MKIYLNIAKGYFAYTSLYKILSQLNIDNLIVCKMSDEHLTELRGKYQIEVIKKDSLYNVLRTDIDMVILCTDGEDSGSIYLTKYAITHRLPVLFLTNLVESNCILEVV